MPVICQITRASEVYMQKVSKIICPKCGKSYPPIKPRTFECGNCHHRTNFTIGEGGFIPTKMGRTPLQKKLKRRPTSITINDDEKEKYDKKGYSPQKLYEIGYAVAVLGIDIQDVL